MALRGLVWAAFVLLAFVAASCGGGDEAAPTPSAYPYEERFAGYEAAPEPNGDLAKVVWPAYVLRALPEVKELYESQVTHGELMRYMPCFCGCGQTDGHRSNRDCYIRRVRADGSVVFDPMAPT